LHEDMTSTKQACFPIMEARCH